MTHFCGHKKPNAWDLYDMHGNVWQWCSDYFGEILAGEAIDPTGPPVGDKSGRRVVRGGAWCNTAAECRAAFRWGMIPDTISVGFRVCLDASQVPADSVTASATTPKPKRFINTLGITFVRIEPGEFMMGSPMGEVGRRDNETQHHVKLTKAFMMASTVVSQSQWVSVMGSNPSQFQGEGFKRWMDVMAVEGVNWNDAVAFCKKLSEKEGKKYRLPTEAEWEYACRAGTTTAYNTGDGEPALNEAAWYKGNSQMRTRDIGHKKPNAWGLYDMHGNVWEWCSDYFADSLAGAVIDPSGPPVGDKNASHVVHGGAWYSPPAECRAAFRMGHAPDPGTIGIGLRLCLDASQVTATNSVTPAEPKLTNASDAKTFTNTLSMKFVRIEPGEFVMGSPAQEWGHAKDETQHRVKLTKPFFMAVYLVTRGQFSAFVKDANYRTEAEKQHWANRISADGTKGDVARDTTWEKPGFDQTDEHPVVEVSWNDAQEFCRWLSVKEGKTYRLPTEAQWEYACRAGTKTANFWGNDPDSGEGFVNGCDLTAQDKFPLWTYAFHWRDGFVFTFPVGTFKPNPWGLYDMIGNVREWCADGYGSYGEADAVDAVGPVANDKSPLVLRGGSWHETGWSCRSACRFQAVPFNRGDDSGFRVCLDLSRTVVETRPN